MTVRVVRKPDDAEELVVQWSDLADQTGGRHYTHPFWCLAWWNHLGRGELHIVVVESAGALLGLAPLYRQRLAGVDRYRFIGANLGPVSEVLVAPGHEAAGRELWSALLDERRSVLDLHGYRHGGLGLTALRRSEGRSWSAELSSACPTIAVKGTLGEYMEARPSSLRRKLRRADHRREQEGASVEVSVFTDIDDVTRRVADVTAVFDRAEAAHPRLHFLSGAYRGFTVDMLRAAASQSRLAMLVLYINDCPVASAFALRSGTTWSYSGPRFDPAAGEFSPGHLVMRALVGHAFAAGATEVDLLTGDLPYKREWSDGAYDVATIYAASSPGLQALRRLADLESNFAGALKASIEGRWHSFWNARGRAASEVVSR